MRRRWNLFSPWTRPSSPQTRTRPCLEALEDRCLPSVNVLTAHNDNSRDGLNAAETTLTPANVNSSQFGKLFTVPVDGQVYAQPLYLSDLTVSGQGTHNVVFVATEHDSVYAFDADTGATLWHDSFINPSAGITTLTTQDVGGCTQITPEIGITATPVIDPSTGTLYVESETKVVSGSSTTYVQALHALDVTTGAEKFGGPVTIHASVPGTGDGGSTVSLIPNDYKARAGLLLLNGVVYVSFASNCDITPAHGWMIGYNASTLQQVSVLCTSPNSQLNTIWMSNAGPAADAGNNIYAVTGNGPISGSSNGFNPAKGDYAETVLKLSTASGLSVTDYFTPYNWQSLDASDEDFGSGGVILVNQPGAANPNLLVTAGKQGTIYLINRDNMGQFHSSGDTIVQELPGAIGSSFGSPAYFNNTLYYGGVNDALKAFAFSNGLLSATPASKSATTFAYPGTTPSISANGSANGIVWAIQNSNHAILHAYDASNLANELYNSDQAGTRDQMDAAVKFTTPTIANGKVYVGTATTLTVFGELPPVGNTQVVSTLNSAGLSDVFAVDQYRSAWTRSETGPGQWSPWLALGGACKSLTVGTTANGTEQLFAVGTDNAVWTRTETAPGQWTAWTSLGGVTGAITVTRNAQGLLDLFAIGTDGAAWTRSETSLGQWSGLWQSLGGVCKSWTAATTANGVEQLFAIGTDNAVWTRTETAPGQWTQFWAGLGGDTGAITVTRNAQGLLDLFAIGTDGAAWTRSETSLDQWSGPWLSLGGACKSLSAGTTASGTEQLFAVGTDNAVWTRAETAPGQWTPWTGLGGVVTGTLAVTAPTSQDLLDLFAIGSDGAVYTSSETTQGSWTPWKRL